MQHHAFEKEALLMVESLRKCYSEIDTIENADIVWLKGRILTDLKKHENALCIQLGIPTSLKDVPLTGGEMAPLTKLFGKSLIKEPAAEGAAPVEITPIKTPAQIEADHLRLRVEEIMPKFLITPTDDLVDVLEDMEIRAIAKKAGLPVTETNPKKITAKYVESIKEAIRKAEELREKGEVNPTTVTPQTDGANGGTDKQ